MKQKYRNILFCILLFCSCLSTETPVDEPEYIVDKGPGEINGFIVNKNFVEPTNEEKEGISFSISENYENDYYSINYENKVYEYNLPIKKREYLNDFTNNPLEDIRGENLIYYFEQYMTNRNYKNIMNNARSNSWVSIKIPENRKIKVGDSWTEYTNGITKDSGVKKKYLSRFSPDGYTMQRTVMDVTENEGSGMFLGSVDNYTFKGIVEDEGIRYAVLKSDMSMITTTYKYSLAESAAYINKGKAIIYYDYKKNKIKEIMYDGIYNAFAGGSLTRPLKWSDVKIDMDDDIKQLNKDVEKMEKSRERADALSGWNSGTIFGAISGLSELSANARQEKIEKESKKIVKAILEEFSKLSEEQVKLIIDKGLNSTDFPLKHDSPIDYKAYYLYKN